MEVTTKSIRGDLPGPCHLQNRVGGHRRSLINKHVSIGLYSNYCEEELSPCPYQGFARDVTNHPNSCASLPVPKEQTLGFRKGQSPPVSVKDADSPRVSQRESRLSDVSLTRSPESEPLFQLRCLLRIPPCHLLSKELRR